MRIQLQMPLEPTTDRNRADRDRPLVKAAVELAADASSTTSVAELMTIDFCIECNRLEGKNNSALNSRLADAAVELARRRILDGNGGPNP